MFDINEKPNVTSIGHYDVSTVAGETIVFDNDDASVQILAESHSEGCYKANQMMGWA